MSICHVVWFITRDEVAGSESGLVRAVSGPRCGLAASAASLIVSFNIGNRPYFAQASPFSLFSLSALAKARQLSSYSFLLFLPVSNPNWDKTSSAHSASTVRYRALIVPFHDNLSYRILEYWSNGFSSRSTALSSVPVRSLE